MYILAQPAYKSRINNPYNWLLYTHIEDLGVDVDEYFPGKMLLKKYSIWHLHWPEFSLNHRNKVKASVKIKALLAQMDWAKLRQVKTIWTIHNLTAHEQLYPELETCFWKAFTQRLDGYISMSQAGLETAKKHFSQLKELPGFVVPHGHYRGEYPDEITSEEARDTLKIPASAKVILFFGRIRPYKNIPQLIRAFKKLSDPSLVLYIVGYSECSTLVEEIAQEAVLEPRVRMHLDFIPTNRTQVYLRAADLVILPYREILNSGSALLALSFNRPILVPEKGALSELQSQVGQEWVRTYTGDLCPLHIAEATEWALGTQRADQAPLEAFDWRELAQQTVEAYKAVTEIR